MRLIKVLFACTMLGVLVFGLPGVSALGQPGDGDSILAQQPKDKDKGKQKGDDYPPPPKDKDKGKQKDKGKDKGKGKEQRQAACDNQPQTDAGEGSPPFCDVEPGTFNGGEDVDVTVTGPTDDEGAVATLVVATIALPQAQSSQVRYENTFSANDEGGLEFFMDDFPEDAPTGTYRVRMEGQESGVVVGGDFEFTHDGQPGPGEGAAADTDADQGGFLAQTGRYITNGLVLALGLLLLGATVLYGVRRVRGSTTVRG